jgi:hypothetical protein
MIRVVPAQGFEPWTIGLKDRCSNLAELRRLNTDCLLTRLSHAGCVAKVKPTAPKAGHRRVGPMAPCYRQVA